VQVDAILAENDELQRRAMQMNSMAGSEGSSAQALLREENALLRQVGGPSLLGWEPGALALMRWLCMLWSARLGRSACAHESWAVVLQVLRVVPTVC